MAQEKSGFHPLGPNRWLGSPVAPSKVSGSFCPDRQWLPLLPDQTVRGPDPLLGSHSPHHGMHQGGLGRQRQGNGRLAFRGIYPEKERHPRTLHARSCQGQGIRSSKDKHRGLRF